MQQWELKAVNEEGLSIHLYAKTKKEVLKKFDSRYPRNGFIIRLCLEISPGEHQRFQIIKSTYQ